MRNAVLADTGPLYAAVDPTDAHHRRAIEELQQFDRRHISVIVCFSTLLETYSLVVYKLGRNVALGWLREIGQAAVINSTPEDYRQATAKIAGFADQSITLFDATVAVLAARMALRVWTYDHHFDVMRIPVWR